MSLLPVLFDMPPYRLSGVVVGALLNDPAQLAALGDAMHRAPYRAPPCAPVLEVKPRHTHAADGDPIVVPDGEDALEIGASLGIVIGRTASRVSASDALDVIAAYLICGDYSLPLASHYRPAVRLKARDGFCPLGPRIVPAADVPDPDALGFEVAVDGVVVQRGSTAGRVRSVAQLTADVSEFMTLQPGDMLLLGRTHGVPTARVGQTVAISFSRLGRLVNRLQREPAAATKQA
jgi:5-oxopent-3-ene-1,2,5-tricarboxylate decarboxylase/2-hydroxyhepta-2,4-diene-1,7-dioate isomerase